MLTVLKNIYIYIDQARRKDEEQKSVSQEKRKRQQSKLKKYPLKPSELSLSERKKQLGQLKIHLHLNPCDNEWFLKPTSTSKHSNLIGRERLVVQKLTERRSKELLHNRKRDKKTKTIRVKPKKMTSMMAVRKEERNPTTGTITNNA